jgi:hypothetical protein
MAGPASKPPGSTTTPALTHVVLVLRTSTQERQALYMVRNKLKKAYDLGAGPLLTTVAKLETFPLRKRSGLASYVVHDNLAKLSVQQVTTDSFLNICSPPLTCSPAHLL